MDQQNTHIGILAGNSRVYLDNNGMVAIEAQLNAFDAALRLARQSLDSGNLLPKLSVAFDHLGIFRLQFLTENLSNAQKTPPAPKPSPSVNPAGFSAYCGKVSDRSQ